MARKEKKVVIEKEPKTKVTADDDTIALYAYLLLEQQAKVKVEQRALNALSKLAAQNGVTWPAIKDALKEYEKTPEARRAKALEAARIYSAIGVPAQLEMFEAYEPKVNDDEAAAERKGRFAAICQGPATPPYPVGSPEGQAWMNGWHAVQRLVSQHRERMKIAQPADTTPAQQQRSDAEDWDDPKNKPVASADQVQTGGAVDYDPDAPKN